MKRITFLAVLFVALFSASATKAQVGFHVGVNVGNPYYAPQHVVVHRPPVYYRRPARVNYYRRPVVYQRYQRHYSHRPVVVHRNYHSYRGYRR